MKKDGTTSQIFSSSSFSSIKKLGNDLRCLLKFLKISLFYITFEKIFQIRTYISLFLCYKLFTLNTYDYIFKKLLIR